MQQTLGIVPFNTKSDILAKISAKDDLKIVLERKFDLSIEATLQILHKDIKEQQTVFGFILEGSNAIEDWLNIISDGDVTKSLIHGSENPDNAHSETDWFQNVVLNNDLNISKTTTSSSSSSSSSSSIPVKVVTNNTRKNLLKTPTTKSNVSGTSPHQRKLGLRDTTVAPTSGDGPRNSLRKPIVRSKIPNAKTGATTTTSTTPTSTTTKTSSRLTNNATTKATPTTASSRRSDLNGRRGSLVTATNTTATTTTGAKKLTTTTKGGVSKNTPPTSVITGRTRKYSKLKEKKPVVATTIKPKKDVPVAVQQKEVSLNNEIKAEKEQETIIERVVEIKEEEKVDEAIAVEEVKELVEETREEENLEEVIEEIVEEKQEEVEKVEEEKTEIIEEKQQRQQQPEEEGEIVKYDEIEEDTNIMLPQQPISHPSTSSSADEHDAEVAATISNKNNGNSNSVKATIYTLQNSGRSSSFSPNSVSSLPRPETPEVDQLRLRFETIIQTSAPTSLYDPQFQRRPSSKISPEFISRIKEMKPKGPVGTKVKSMVELFMDENLNKWEF